MKIKHTLCGAVAAVAVLASVSAKAEDNLSSQVNTAISNKNMTEVASLLSKDKKNVDTVLKALLRKTQETIKTDPDFSGKMMSLAGQYASQISPPSVPVICADLRRIIENFPGNQVGTPLYETVVGASQSFSSAPVVVAQGRPNLCEEAWLQLARLGGTDEDALLAMTPGLRSPGLPPVTIGLPPVEPPPTKKPSAD